MRQKFLPAIGLFILCLGFLTLSHTILQLYKLDNPVSSQSPLPDYLSLITNPSVTSLSLWMPVIKADASSKLSLTSESALSYDLTRDKVLYEKNSSEKLPMASLTKIMTAIVALEHPKADDTYTASAANLVGEDSMGIDAGESFTLKELMYGLILKSGNDAAEVIAANSAYGRQGFVDLMNEKAQSLGLTETHFTNPTGLEGDGDQHTSAHDLLIMTRYALEHFPLFAEVAATQSIVLDSTSTHKEFDLYNETNLITSYPGVKGVKTGFTPEAGSCLVTYLEYDNHKIIAVLLRSDDRRGEMKDLLDYSLKSEGITPPQHE